MAAQTLAEFMAKYDPEGDRTVAIVEAKSPNDGTPFVVARAGKFTAVITLANLGDHLSIDIHPFVDGQDAGPAARWSSASTSGCTGHHTGPTRC